MICCIPPQMWRRTIKIPIFCGYFRVTSTYVEKRLNKYQFISILFSQMSKTSLVLYFLTHLQYTIFLQDVNLFLKLIQKITKKDCIISIFFFTVFISDLLEWKCVYFCLSNVKWIKFKNFVVQLLDKFFVNMIINSV